MRRSFPYVPRSSRRAGLLVGLGVGALIFADGFWSLHFLGALFFAALGSVGMFLCISAGLSPTLRSRILAIIADRMLEVIDVQDLITVLDFMAGAYYPAGSTDLKGYYQYLATLPRLRRQS